MRRPGSSAAAAALMLALAAPPARAQAGTGNAAAAEALFREGRALVAEGRHEEACPRFAASQRLDPGYGTLWNLAGCLETIGRTASAWAAFREAADMARRASEEEREEKAERRAAALEPGLSRLRVVVAAPAPGLEVRRDGAPLLEGSWGEALPVDPGRIRVEARAPGRRSFAVEVEAAGAGRTATVEIPALAEAATSAAPPRDAPAAAAGGAQRAIAYAAGGIGLAGVAVGAIFGLRAGAAWGEAQRQHCRTGARCDDEGVALAAEADTAAILSNVAFAVGGAGLAAGVILLVTAPDEGAQRARAARLVIAPAVGASGGGITLQGRF